jgi:tellurite resistance protein TehA-like permease
MFWPEAAQRTSSAVVANPLATGGLGLLTFLVSPLVLLFMTITIVFIPVALIIVIVLIVAGVYGWIAVGLEVGDRLAEAFSWELHSAASAGLGTFLLTFVVGGIGMIPCVGWIAPFLVASMGLGGVILTRFGSQDYVIANPSAPEKSTPKGRKVAKKDE